VDTTQHGRTKIGNGTDKQANTNLATPFVTELNNLAQQWNDL
jgi:hypothetical protein